jgi:CRISPR/Cas system CMR subunit Cmr4 (Cas7 group RAMP superfamily)
MRTDLVQIEYNLRFTTPFHCGTGIRAGLIDRTVVRNSQGHLYIPGSTFKGVLRERCAQLAQLYSEQKELISSPHDAEAALLALGRTSPTLVTRIFGSQSIPGRLYFDDACQEDTQQYDSSEHGGEGRYLSLQTDIATQVRLDRLTRTAVPGALYTSEFGTRDITLKGNVQGWLTCEAIDLAEPAPTYSFLLLLAGLHLIDRLGGNKSTGKGCCSCTLASVTLNHESIPAALWTTWLEQLGQLADYDYLLDASSEQGGHA